MEADESLKQQFKLLQEQQQQKLLRRKQMKEEKENLSNNSVEKKTFGVDDNLDLKLERSTGVGYLSEELVEHLNNEIRELKDENGRCYKLLSEREFEIKQLKKKKNEEKNALSGMQVTNETAGTKIVELSKKVRELTAELESEKTRSKQINKKCHDLQMQMSSVPDDTSRSSLGSAVSQRSVYYTDNDKEQLEVDIKALQDKLKHTENKVAEFRNQSTQYKQELKLAHKALSQEVGENVNIQILLSGQSNWRGRAQQILLLQKKVEELKNQVDTTPKKLRDLDEDDLENEFMGRTSSKKRNQDEKYKEELKKYEKEKKEAYEKMANEFKALENDHSTVKSKFEAAKARNKVLSNENKSIKQQMTTLLEKGKNDDELIQALMKQQAQLKDMLDQTTSQQRQNNLNQVDKLKEMAVKSQQESNIVEQLKCIISERELMVHRLEEEINQLKIQHLQKLQSENQYLEKPVLGRSISRQTTDPMVLKSVSPPSSRHGERPPSGRIDSGRNSSRTSLVRPQSSSNNTVQNQQVAELEYQCQEYKILLQTSEVERERLTELLQILQKRVDENIVKLNESQNELINQRRNNALLEKQVAKYKVEQAKQNKGNTTGRKKGPVNQGLSRLTNDTSYNEEDHIESLDELQTCLEIQKDENEALKSALQSTLNAKQEDLRIYSQTMDETKKVFLQALRQFKQSAGT
ncbi:hypothetical protein LOTGIDRAFT_159823 [Lottia gigantea]|uniref:Coiled-coil domain-containing protein 13 n=1 Tax=Lottia gigantea TaxID=225164 RepID=V4C4F0_LOTGI|nr:hypothetical protein LOTGIDRAFT_159823 [Lottia gigantea]ESO96414.1 hypothetical protein LOTGIDRAFT_159823 [Lottia gigantea]